MSKKKYISSAVLAKLKKPLIFMDLNFPKLNDKQLLIKVLYSGVCRSQLMEMDGKRGKDKWLPHLLGHEGVGVVWNKGKKVKKFKIGDKVILTWIKCNGSSSKNPTYISSKKKRINAGKITTFSNFTVTSENRLVKKPKSMPLELAPIFGCAFQTGPGMILNQIKIKQNDFIAVFGLGGVGLSSLAVLKALNVKNVICIDKNFKKLKIAKKLGFKKLINLKKDSLFKMVKKFTNGIGVQYCIESAGESKTIEFGMSILKKNGKIVFASHPEENKKISINPHDLISGKKIEGSWGGQCSPDKDIPKVFNLLKKKGIDLSCFTQKIYPLKKINNAIKDFRAGKVIRPVIKMTH